jgi:arsenite oxidase small subunit
MERRTFIEACATSCGASSLLGLASNSADAAQPSAAAALEMKAKAYASALLVDEHGDAIKASSLKAGINYVFHYPFQGTPVFLLNLGKATASAPLKTKAGEDYAWPGGVGKARAIVAYSAICAHKLVYPTKDVSFISFRAGKSPISPHEGVIHCCADNSQYDPSQGAKVLSGPAEQPLCAVILQHDAKTDQLTATGTLGGELFDAFFKKYEFRLQLDVGAKATQQAAAKTVVSELAKFCKQAVSC